MTALGAFPSPGAWQGAGMCMPGPGSPVAAVSFLAMWLAMTAAMMSPSVAPTLWRYRQAAALAGAAHPGRRTLLAATAYLLVWTLCGLAALVLGAGLTNVGRGLPLSPRQLAMAGAVVVLAAGGLQFTAWKARRLACCRGAADRVGSPWGHGLQLGLQCCACCAGLTASLLVIGPMDLGPMAVTTAAVTFERLAPERAGAARLVGVGLVLEGLVLAARAAGVV